MSQTFNMPPAGTDNLGPFLKETLPNALDALRTMFAGTTEPSSPVARQPWADTTTGLLKFRNAANDDWIVVGPLGGIGRQDHRVELLAVSATTRRRVLCATQGMVVERVTLLSSAVTSGSTGSNEWRWKLYNETAAIDLFSGAVGTGTTLGGVGGGELAVNTPYVLIPDQNATLAANAVLSFEATKVGTPSTATLTEVVALIQGYRKA